MCSDPHRGCMITSSIEIVLASLGFMISASAIKYQDEFNEAVKEQVGDTSPTLDVTVASVICAFFFLGIMTASAGVHGYRSRNRWFYLIHLIFALFLSLCSFATFIDGVVQVNRMKAHVAGQTPTAAPQTGTNATTTVAPTVGPTTTSDSEKLEIGEMVERLIFPFIICFVHIGLYGVSGRFAWKAWQDTTNPTIQREILEEEPESKQDPIS